MPRYVKNYWAVRLARLAYRLQRATETAVEFVWNEDMASWHFEGRSLTWTEEVPTWCAGFKEGWMAAEEGGHPWFERAEHGIASAETGDR